MTYEDLFDSANTLFDDLCAKFSEKLGDVINEHEAELMLEVANGASLTNVFTAEVVEVAKLANDAGLIMARLDELRVQDKRNSAKAGDGFCCGELMCDGKCIEPDCPCEH